MLRGVEMDRRSVVERANFGRLNRMDEPEGAGDFGGEVP